ncbi:MAG: ABC transporter substrate-binding protein [Chloroflexota bacterium]|nr:ABC transporter substrate-binding protein [Chloroflexota bacterium]
MNLTRRSFLVTSLAAMAAACSPAAAPSKPSESKPTTDSPAQQAPAQKPAEVAEAAKPADAAKPTDAKPAAKVDVGGTPRPGGELSFIVSAEPPSFDAHRETTFAMLHPTAPHYSLLVRFDQDTYPEIVGDLAERWDISPDRLTYTFRLRDGVKFHDGSALTSRDVKASYDKIIAPPEGVVSARKASFAAVQSVDAPDPLTVVFKLKYPSASLMNMIASPWNYIFSADKLAQDPRWYEKNIMGSGPYTFVEYVPGSHWVGKKNPNYFVQGRPYLDGFRATFIREAAAQVAAIRGGRAAIEFRGFTPPQRDDLVRALGDQIVVQESPWITVLLAVFNTEKQPFDDPRVRRALTLAIDRWEGSNALSKITFVKPVGGLLRPGGPFSRPDAELEKLPGFGRDINAARDEARRLLREAGVPDGFEITITNRDTPNPYETVGVFVIDQWRKIGLNATQQQLETNQYISNQRNGNFDVSIDFLADYVDDPELQMSKFVSADRSPTNYGRYKDPEVDQLFDQQSRESDPEQRKQLIWKLEERLIGEQAYVLPLIWWQRIIPHSAQVKGWRALPSHYINQDLGNVWLAG